MARVRNDAAKKDLRSAIGNRLREVRQELWDGHFDGLCVTLGVSRRSWWNWETGNAVPPEVLLRFILVAEIHPQWLLTGEGPRYTPAFRSLAGDHPALTCWL
jgi:hypothetical protein